VLKKRRANFVNTICTTQASLPHCRPMNGHYIARRPTPNNTWPNISQTCSGATRLFLFTPLGGAHNPQWLRHGSIAF